MRSALSDLLIALLAVTALLVATAYIIVFGCSLMGIDPGVVFGMKKGQLIEICRAGTFMSVALIIALHKNEIVPVQMISPQRK